MFQKEQQQKWYTERGKFDVQSIDRSNQFWLSKEKRYIFSKPNSLAPSKCVSIKVDLFGVDTVLVRLLVYVSRQLRPVDRFTSLESQGILSQSIKWRRQLKTLFQ